VRQDKLSPLTDLTNPLPKTRQVLLINKPLQIPSLSRALPPISSPYLYHHRRSVPVSQGKRCLPVPFPLYLVGFVLDRSVPLDPCHFCVVSSISRPVRPIVENGPVGSLVGSDRRRRAPIWWVRIDLRTASGAQI
jgi:hypothetical protein